ncbi:MAG: DUF805 domain-containing protein [Sulfurovaceae bacterium]|nr:DUF805 domain-containing protein [Sulfurovaceae bacterium]
MNYIITKKYAKFRGRASRSEFWYFILFSIIITLLAGILGHRLGISYSIPVDSVQFVKETGEVIKTTITQPINLLMVASGLILFIPFIAISVRRLHDIGKNGWWYLIAFIPWLGVLILLVLFILPSQDRINRYGFMHHSEIVDLS